jgi:hypothetical protein
MVVIPPQYRRPQMPEKPERSFGEKVAAQWPLGLAILLCLCGVGLFVLSAEYQIPYGSRLALGSFVGGLAAFFYWALANRNDDYNF